jgi:hypothetical protein
MPDLDTIVALGVDGDPQPKMAMREDFAGAAIQNPLSILLCFRVPLFPHA